MSLLVGLIFVGIPHFLPPWISNFFWSLIPWSKFPHMCLKVWRRALGNWPNTMVENLKLNCSAIAYQQCFYNSNDHCSCRIFYCCFPLAFSNHTSVYGLSWRFFSYFFEEQWTEYLTGLSRALFPTTFLEIAVYNFVVCTSVRRKGNPSL